MADVTPSGIAIPLQTTSQAGPQEESSKSDNPHTFLRHKRRWFRAWEQNKRNELLEQQLSDRYYHSKQWTDEELAKFKRRKQPAITSNRVKRKIDFLTGVEERLRRDPKAYGRNPGVDQESADVWTGGIRFVMDQTRGARLIAKSISTGLRRGIGAMFCGIEEVKGKLEVVMRYVEGDRFFYDPRSVNDDFSDARFLGVSQWVDIDDAREEWPEANFEKYFEKDGGMTSFIHEEDRAEQWGDFEHRRVRIVEMWWKELGVWYFCKFCGDLILEGGQSPYINSDDMSDQPYIAWTAYVDEKGVRYGLVRDMKTLQDEVNHRRSKSLQEINSRQVYMQEGIVDDEDLLREEAAKTDGLIIFKGGEWGKDIGFVDRTKELQGNIELMVQATQEIENLGPNPGLIGNGTGVEAASGRALIAQRDSGMTELQPVFSNVRDFKLRIYRCIHGRMRQAWTEQRWIRVTDNPDAPQFVPVNNYQIDPMTGQLVGQNIIGKIDVDIILEEGPDTITVQEELFQMLGQLGEAAMSPVGRAMIELSGITNKDRIIEILDGAAQDMQGEPDPMQIQAAQQQLQGQAAQIAKLQADTQKTVADAQKIEIEARKLAKDADINDEKLPYEIENVEASTIKMLSDASSNRMNKLLSSNRE